MCRRFPPQNADGGSLGLVKQALEAVRHRFEDMDTFLGHQYLKLNPQVLDHRRHLRYEYEQPLRCIEERLLAFQ